MLRTRTSAPVAAPSLAPSPSAEVFYASDALTAQARSLAASQNALGAELLAAEATLSSALWAAFPTQSVPHLALASRDFIALESSLYYYLPGRGQVTPPAELDAAWKRFSALLAAWRSVSVAAVSASYLISTTVASPAELARTVVRIRSTAPRTEATLVLSSALAEVASALPSDLFDDASLSTSLAPDSLELRTEAGTLSRAFVAPAGFTPEQSYRYAALRSSGLSIADAAARS